MSILPRAAAALALLLDSCLPRSCVACGAPTAEPGAAAWVEGFLCGPCLASLRPLPAPRCATCGRPLLAETGSCLRCRDAPSALDGAHPLFAYRGTAAALVRAFKFGGMRGLARPLAALAEESLTRLGAARSSAEGFLLVPVPPRPGKLRREGRDQVEDLLRALEARGWRAERLLRRLPGAEQKKLDREGRLRNARSSYVLAAPLPLPPRLLLVDDVITTGATLEACAEALRGGGARELRAFAFAAEL